MTPSREGASVTPSHSPFWPCHWCGVQAVDYPALALHQRAACRVLRRFRHLRAERDAIRDAPRVLAQAEPRKLWFEG